jgi:hypothetical protein
MRCRNCQELGGGGGMVLFSTGQGNLYIYIYIFIYIKTFLNNKDVNIGCFIFLV